MTRFYCISLYSRGDRPTRNLLISPHPNGGIYGCLQSHMKIWQQLSESNLTDNELVVIFEDDMKVNRKLSPGDFQDLPI